jgi:phage recombination protein Bet
MNAVAQIQPSRLPISPAIAREFDIQPTEWRVLVDQLFPAAKSVESVMMALAYCRKRNLDIFKKPVHIVPMWSAAKGQMVETVWPGIAEIRTTASRTGEYAGIDAVEFGPMVERTFTGTIGKGQREENVTKKVRFPEWASVVVYRMVGGERCAYHAKVFWEETFATIGKSEVPNDMWAKRPRGQLDKCVEAAALRKAFPEELGNTYAAEEMEGRTIEGDAVERAASPPAPKPPVPPKPPVADIVEAEVIDDRDIVHETGEAVDAVMGAGEPVDEWPADDTEFFTKLDDDLACAGDLDTLEEIWTSADAMARFTGKPQGEIKQGIAKGIKNRHVKRIGGA